MAKYKKKNKTKTIVSVIVTVALLLLLGAGVASFSKSDTKTIGATAFSVGVLDENGKFIDDDQAIYTKEAFECIGLRIEPDFDSSVTYDVYYYDYNEKLIEVKSGLTEIYDEDFPMAKLCRVVIHPGIPEGETSRSFKISFWEVFGFAKELKITVDKNQKYLYENSVNLFISENAELSKTFDSNATTVALTENESYKVSEQITVTGDYDYYDIYVLKASESADKVSVAIAYSEDNTIFEREACELDNCVVGEWSKLTVKLSELNGDAYLIVSMPSDADCYIYAYNK